MIVFALYTFPPPPLAVRRDSVRHAVARSASASASASASSSNGASGSGSVAGLAHPWDGMPEWEDAVPAALNITLMATVLVTKVDRTS